MMLDGARSRRARLRKGVCSDLDKVISSPRMHYVSPQTVPKIGLRTRVAGFGLLAAVGLAFFLSAKMGLAGLIVELAQQEADRWESAPRTLNPRELTRVAGYYSDALAYAPDSPWALEGLGVLNLRRVKLSRSASEAVAFAGAARDQFRLALRQRPTSPFLWANLALAKLYLDQPDDEFLQSLRHANELGPWEPSTQQALLFSGLAAWDRLAPADRRMMEGIVERGAARNASKLFGIVKSYRRLDLVCGLKGYDSIAAPDCRKRAGASTGRTQEGK